MNAQQLKNSILQMAVSGKLVPQDPNDEPASVLLERIRAEKEKLIKEGRIKRDKKPSIMRWICFLYAVAFACGGVMCLLGCSNIVRRLTGSIL